MTTTTQMTPIELSLLDLYRDIEHAETREQVKHILRRIEALKRAQRLND